MKKTILWILMLPVAAPLFGQNDVLYQVSTLEALVGGVFDGPTTLGSLKAHGDFGIGTFNAVDGEMMLIDGLFYRVDGLGRVRLAPDTAKTPFAAVTFFEPDRSLAVASPVSMDSLYRRIDRSLPSPNLFYAVRITGTFKTVRTRSVPRQSRPYPKLTEVTKTQPVFEFADASGMMVGFRCPAFTRNVNFPGYHLHFLANEGGGGGHVLAFTADRVTVEIDDTDGFFLSLPDDADFLKAELSGTDGADVKKAEK
jgi:acetolactate decarboxylase